MGFSVQNCRTVAVPTEKRYNQKLGNYKDCFEKYIREVNPCIRELLKEYTKRVLIENNYLEISSPKLNPDIYSEIDFDEIRLQSRSHIVQLKPIMYISDEKYTIYSEDEGFLIDKLTRHIVPFNYEDRYKIIEFLIGKFNKKLKVIRRYIHKGKTIAVCVY